MRQKFNSEQIDCSISGCPGEDHQDVTICFFSVCKSGMHTDTEIQNGVNKDKTTILSPGKRLKYLFQI